MPYQWETDLATVRKLRRDVYRLLAAEAGLAAPDAIADALDAVKLHGWDGDSLTDFVVALDAAADARGMALADLARILSADGNECDRFVKFAASLSPADPYAAAAGAGLPELDQLSRRSSQPNPSRARFSPGVRAALLKLGRDPNTIDSRSLGEQWAAQMQARQLARARRLGIPARVPTQPVSSIRDVTDPHRPQPAGYAALGHAYQLATGLPPGGATPAYEPGPRGRPYQVPATSDVAPRPAAETPPQPGLLQAAYDTVRRRGYVAPLGQFEHECARWGSTLGFDTNRVLRLLTDQDRGATSYSLFQRFVGSQTAATVALSRDTDDPWSTAMAAAAERRRQRVALPAEDEYARRTGR